MSRTAAFLWGMLGGLCLGSFMWTVRYLERALRRPGVATFTVTSDQWTEPYETTGI